MSTAICVMNAYGLSKQVSQRVSPEAQNLSRTPFAASGTYEPTWRLISGNCFRTKLRVAALLCTASMPSKTSGQSMNLLILGDDSASSRSTCRSWPFVVQRALSEQARGRTERLCSERMQYNTTAAWYMFPRSIQSSFDEGLDSAHCSGEKPWIRLSIPYASCERPPAPVDLSFVARIRRWLILMISANRGGGHMWKGDIAPLYCSRMNSSSSRCELVMARSDAGDVVFPMTAMLCEASQF
jgi:hypothetical protein